MDFDPVAYAIPVFVALIVAELVWAKTTGRHDAYESRDTATSLAIGLGSTVAGALSGAAVVAMLAAVHAASPFSIPMAIRQTGFCAPAMLVSPAWTSIPLPMPFPFSSR